MDRELIDRTWRVLPAEFKEEVKNRYKNALQFNEYAHECVVFRSLFGEHNLTSDAQEEEMLTVSAKRVRQNYNDKLKAKGSHTATQHDKDMATGWCNALRFIFGSKCLPDEPNLSENLTGSEPKPAEPKFKVGDKVRFSGDNKIYEVDGRLYDSYHLKGWSDNVYIYADNLEPYTEPTDHIVADHEKVDHIADPDKMMDNIIKDGFRDHNRLHIASVLMAGLLANGKEKHPVRRALELTNALIAECKKGGGC